MGGERLVLIFQYFVLSIYFPLLYKPTARINVMYFLQNFKNQGIGIKGRKMVLVWHEKASRTALLLQTSSVLHTHTLLVQTHNMTTVKEISEQCLCCTTILFVKSRTTHTKLV